MLINIIRKACKFEEKFTTKNSYELVQSLKNIQLPLNAKLNSFDVHIFFPNISPTEKTVFNKKNYK